MGLDHAASLRETMNTFLQSYFERIHTAIPGRIDAYDAATRKATVQPLVNHWFQNGDVSAKIPAIREVPVMVMGNSTALIEVELSVGDGCLIIFAETGIGDYLNSNGKQVVDSDDPARFQLTDAICIPFLFPFSAVPKPLSSLSLRKDGSVSLKAGSGAEISLSKAGKVAFDGKLATLKETVAQLEAIVTAQQTLLKTFMAACALPAILDPGLKTAAGAYTSGAATTLDIEIPKLVALEGKLFA